MILVILVAAATYGYTQGWFSNFGSNFSIQGTHGNGGGSGTAVDRQLQIALTDKYSGAALASKTIYLYTGNPPVLAEALTTNGAGVATTADKYNSSTLLNIEYVSGNSKIWYAVTVPTMNAADAQSQTYNSIDLQAFTIGTYSQTLEVSSVNAASNYTISTMGGNVAPTFVYQITNTGADNTGLMNSQTPDPIYGDMWQTYLVVTLSGTNYNTVLMNGFDQTFPNGLSTVGVIQLNPNMLTLWKVGNVFEPGYTGGQTLTFSLDLSGYVGNAATMTVTAYAYCDPNYAQSHGGNFGNAKVQLSTCTVDLKNTP
jgi:hypothetical protein